MKKEKLIICLIILFFIYPSIGFCAGKIRIAVVDLNRCIRESLKGKRLYRRLEDKRDVLQKKLRQKEEELRKLEEELRTKEMMLSPEALRKKRRLLARKQEEYRFMLEDAQDELKDEETQGVQKLLAGISKVINRIAKKEGYILVLEKSRGGVLYNIPKIDITDEVIKEFDNLK